MEAILSGILLSISFVLGLLALLLMLIATYFYQGVVVKLVQDLQDGRRDSSVGDLFGSVVPVVLPLIGLAIVAGIGIGLGLLLLVIPGLILLTIWAVAAPAVVLERVGVFRALGRSRELVRGNGWQVFGVIVIVVVIQIVVGLILGGIGAAFGTAGQIIFRLIGNVLTAPLFALAATVVYLSLLQQKGEAAPLAATPGGPTPATAPQPPPSAPTSPGQGPPAGPPAG